MEPRLYGKVTNYSSRVSGIGPRKKTNIVSDFPDDVTAAALRLVQQCVKMYVQHKNDSMTLNLYHFNSYFNAVPIPE